MDAPKTKLYILRGLPASGKSTWAKQIKAKYHNLPHAIVNKDQLRVMLHDDVFNFQNERLTSSASALLVKHFLSDNVNVIVDDTNLNPKTLNVYTKIANDLGVPYEILDFDTPYKQCIERDNEREKRVGRHVIERMALQYGYIKFMPEEVVLCDLDGTLCDIEHRRHYVTGEKKDWKGFFQDIHKDTLRREVKLMLDLHVANGKKIILVSGRPDTYRNVTEKWLRDNGIEYLTLLMRGSHDMRADTEVKKDILNDIILKHNTIDCITDVIDDRPSVIRMWKSEGLPVTDVGDGVEF